MSCLYYITLITSQWVDDQWINTKPLIGHNLQDVNFWYEKIM